LVIREVIKREGMVSDLISSQFTVSKRHFKEAVSLYRSNRGGNNE